MISQEIMLRIIRMGSLAPSGDNSQPWKFGFQNNTLYLFNIPGKDNPVFNFRQNGSFVAHGGVIENCMIQARVEGFEASVTLFPQPGNKELVAKIIFSENLSGQSKEEQDLARAIPLRSSNRRPYKKTPIAAEKKTILLHEVANLGLGTMRFVEDMEIKKELGKALSTTEKVVLETEKLHSFFFSHICWNERQERSQRNGLYLKTLELSPPQQIAFRLFRYWPLMRVFNAIGLSNMVAKENASLYASSGALGIVMMDGNNSSDFVNAGRLMERIWLRATALGLALHPVTGILFMMQRILAGKPEKLLKAHVALIENAYKKICTVFDVPKGKTIAMLFRIGSAPSPSARCSRLEPTILSAEQLSANLRL